MTLMRAIVAFLISCAAFAQHPDGAKLVGHWVGSGRFYDVKVQAERGSIAFDLHFQPDLTLTGTVGGAKLQPCKPKKIGSSIDFYTTLRGNVFPKKGFRKDHLVLLVTQTDGKEMSADFHLKTNFIFDWSMRPGEVIAIRKE